MRSSKAFVITLETKENRAILCLPVTLSFLKPQTESRELQNCGFFLLILKTHYFKKCLLVIQVFDVAIYKPNRSMTWASAEFHLTVKATGTATVCTHDFLPL